MSLHEQFQQLVDDSFYELATALVVRKVEARGFRLSAEHKRLIEERLRLGGEGSIELSIDDNTEAGPVSVDIDEQDLMELEVQAGKFFDGLPELTRRLVEEVSPGILAGIRKYYPGEIRADLKQGKEFQARLARRWKRPLDLLRLVVEVSYRAGVEAGDRISAAGFEHPQLAFVLVRLHARGIRVAKETLLLLEGGFPEGAMARWRTLHELAIVGNFIQENGELCAKAYLAHQAVESFKGASQYQEACPRLGFQPISDEEMKTIRDAYEEVILTYGNSFKDDYGWAAPFLSGRPAHFASLEAAVQLGHIRPFYRMAGHQVHANPKGLFAPLADPQDAVVLLGPSNTGLADPGQNTALSLSMLTSCLLAVSSTIDAIVAMLVLEELSTDAMHSFVETQQKLEDEDPRARPKGD